MKSKVVIEMNDTELGEMLMTAWVNGWKDSGKDDSHKKKYAFETLQSLNWERTGKIVGKEK